MGNIILKVEERLNDANNKAKKLRAEGYIPGVIYGKEIGSRAIKVKVSDMRALLSKYSRTSLITATFDNGESFPAMIKDIQYGVLKDEYISVDLHQISMSEKVRTSIPIRILGREMIEKAGGVLAQQLDNVEIECLPQNIPQYIEVDIADMTVGQSLSAGELKLDESITLIADPEQVVLSITAGKTAAAEEEETETEEAVEATES